MSTDKNFSLRKNGLALGAERLASVCKRTDDFVDGEVDRATLEMLNEKIASLQSSGSADSALLARALADENSPKRHEGLIVCRTEFVNTTLRRALESCYGKSKTNTLYDFMHRNGSGRLERERIAIGMYKLHYVDEARSFISGLKDKELEYFLTLVNSASNAPLVSHDKETVRAYQRENKFACDKASLTEKILSAFVPDASGGVSAVMSATMEFFKEKMNLKGKDEQSTDEVCIELLTSPLGLVMMLLVSCVTGGTGLVAAMLPAYAAWNTFSNVKNLTSETKDATDIHDLTSGANAARLVTTTDSDFKQPKDISSYITETNTEKYAASRTRGVGSR
ncbi:hypothetical protein [Candidatus Anaplasma sp. TIGMIC]|uniref:hypothetical protein n=1 Tax=Candidatus Anaplasma sp. TIGMIC TaxID=3020713 RepID=UPI00232BA897|nr:hypothetical protein [Candidatus Anaplasma sp. TIGMIC]MDB1135085.1 hypothetical protein [Candidatus Anaplasma sp. TIGMIC]